MGILDNIFPRGNSRKKPEIPAVPKDAYLVTFNLSGKTSLDKVKFCQEFFGRKAGEGVLKEAGGKKLGPGCVLVPSGSIDKIEKFMGERKVRMQKQKIILVE